MGQGFQVVALCYLQGMSGMQQLDHNFACFLRGCGGESQRAEEEHCAEASSVNSGLHLAPDAWLFVQGLRGFCPLKPKGKWDVGGGLLGNPGHGTSL